MKKINSQNQPIKVEMIDTDRLYAINKLANAIDQLAQALNQAPRCVVSNCLFVNNTGSKTPSVAIESIRK